LGRDEISFNYSPDRHIGIMYEKAQAAGKPLPLSVSIGLDPAVYIGACFEPPVTPFGYDELGIAGALRGRPVELAPCVTVSETAVANAEFVIEGELLPDKHVSEDSLTGLGISIPEFPGYNGGVNKAATVFKVKAITHRANPIYQTCIGASEEHVCLAGPATEASIMEMVERAMPGKLMNVNLHSAGGGKLMAILQFRKARASDEGGQRQAALLAFTSFAELKHVFLVDEDVDPFDTGDVLWALTTRFQGDLDIITIPGVRCHPADPSASVAYSPLTRFVGNSCKTIFDCTVPFALKEKFKRPEFLELDPKKYFPDLF
jgi:4-hydroxy-3-polyprenylbenzoate decarboxylase